ncbi:MAG: response regulator [Methanomassiliicoccales archaeon]|nr:response regulator [Methanomassiliicoccales archaeon]NYT16190.1 response regulator [Methanomassiliicoccales archaeon]
MNKDLHRILIVEDNEEHVALDREYLPENEFYVDSAPDKHTALQKLKNKSYDLVVLDYQLPDGNGIELLIEMKSLGIDVPVILLTNYDEPDLSFEARKLGAVDYWVKGYQYFTQLRERILESIDSSDL